MTSFNSFFTKGDSHNTKLIYFPGVVVFVYTHFRTQIEGIKTKDVPK